MSRILTSPVSNYDPYELGTINPDSIGLPFLRARSMKSPYDEISNLTLTCDNLKRQISELEDKYLSMIEDPKGNFALDLSKSIHSLESKLDKRESYVKDVSEDIEIFKSYFITGSTSAAPRLKMENLSINIMMTSDQLSFMTTEQLTSQIESLKQILKNQNNEIQKLKGRMSLFNKAVSENRVKHMIEALKSGRQPMLVDGEPVRYEDELLEKKKLLLAEKMVLVAQRIQLVEKRKQKREKTRLRSHENKAAIVIQRNLRRFLWRRYYNHRVAAAVKIQKIVRGWLVRRLHLVVFNQPTSRLMDENEIVAYESEDINESDEIALTPTPNGETVINE